MCLMKMPKMPQARTPLAAFDNREATSMADAEARLRRRRAGAAADVLTSPVGIPSTSTMGGVAQ